MFDLDMSGDATADGEGNRTYEIEWRLVSANTSYGDGETITSGEFSQTLAPGAPIAFFTTGQVAFDFYAATKGGDRLMILQMRFKSGSATTVASVRNVRLRGWTLA
ncbi:hypothetical protein [Brevundimonas sp. SL161]|uniref:hypothetical protein n=1 Tax=Brevundimonas sp. SL161 TaxID=2804613 RepID=UPI003CF69024